MRSHGIARVSPGRLLLSLVIGVIALPQCTKSEEDRTSWADDLDVQRERYRRLGFDFDEAKAKEDAVCIVRSAELPDIIVAGGRRRTRDGFEVGPKCDYDSVIMGAKTFIAGVDKATDRAMLFGGWRHSDEAEKQALFLAWFSFGLTAGGEPVEAGHEKPLLAVGKAWSPPKVEHQDKRYVVTAWVKGIGSDGSERFELKQCAMTEALNFEGCSVLDALGGE